MAETITSRTADGRAFLRGLGRAFAGALIFALPMLMTMEMWVLGFAMQPLRLVLLLVLTLPLLIGLSQYGGFRRPTTLAEGVVDAFTALAIAGLAASATLYAFGLLTPDMSAREVIGKISLQMVPGSIGAMLARSQFGGRGDSEELEPLHPSYFGELFLMAVGALFLSLNVAPTEETMLISYRMPVWKELLLIGLSLILMHAFVYGVEFAGQEDAGPDAGLWSTFFRFTLVGYALVLLLSLYVLWTFGRADGVSLEHTLSAAIVLGFPGAIGAATARLLL